MGAFPVWGPYWIILNSIVKIIAPAIITKISCCQLILRRRFFCWVFFLVLAMACSGRDDTTRVGKASSRRGYTVFFGDTLSGILVR